MPHFQESTEQVEDSRGSGFLRRRFKERVISNKQEELLPTYSLLDNSRTLTLLKFETEFTFEAIFFEVVAGVP